MASNRWYESASETMRVLAGFSVGSGPGSVAARNATVGSGMLECIALLLRQTWLTPRR